MVGTLSVCLWGLGVYGVGRLCGYGIHWSPRYLSSAREAHVLVSNALLLHSLIAFPHCSVSLSAGLLCLRYGDVWSFSNASPIDDYWRPLKQNYYW